MPYIKKEQRTKFEPTIYTILQDLIKSDKSFEVGELNYIISSIIWKIFDNKRSYTNGNNLVGVLECVKNEFIRRRLNDYEDQKIKENGDI